MVEAIIPRRRIVTENNNIIQIVAWVVPKSRYYPEGVKYSFVFIHENKRVIGFDNFQSEGHHKHYLGKKEPYIFKSLGETEEQFFNLVEEYEMKQGEGK